MYIYYFPYATLIDVLITNTIFIQHRWMHFILFNFVVFVSKEKQQSAPGDENVDEVVKMENVFDSFNESGLRLVTKNAFIVCITNYSFPRCFYLVHFQEKEI